MNNNWDKYKIHKTIPKALQRWFRSEINTGFLEEIGGGQDEGPNDQEWNGEKGKWKSFPFFSKYLLLFYGLSIQLVI